MPEISSIPGSNGLTGTVICTNATNAFSASFQAYKVTLQNSNYVGYYTWALDGSLFDGGTGPEGYSYGTITVPKEGEAIAAMYLSDGLFPVVAGELTKDGLWPFYLSLYGGHGSLSGWLTFATNGLTTSSMQWFKNPMTGGDYTNGFTLTNLALILSPYQKGTNTLGTSNVVVLLAGGGLTNSLTDYVTLGAGTNFLVTDTNSVAVSLNLKTGFFTGTFIDPQDGKSAPLRGVEVQPSGLAFGLFTITNHLSGAATITAAPAP